jgi:hypothetical protein
LDVQDAWAREIGCCASHISNPVIFLGRLPISPRWRRFWQSGRALAFPLVCKIVESAGGIASRYSLQLAFTYIFCCILDVLLSSGANF